MDCTKASKILAWICSSLFVAFVILGSTQVAKAQDPFEIRVEEYEEPALGGFSLEEHVNYVQSGTANSDGSVAPTSRQLHVSSELTGGITNHISLGFMVMTARLPRASMEYAGWRVLPHFYAPDSWHLPVKIGLTTEFSFQRVAFDESSSTVELRPIIEKSIGRARFDVNPAFERPLARSLVGNSWAFQPSFRFAYQASPRFSPSLEYYGVVGSLGKLLPVENEVHQIFPGASIRLAAGIQWDIGVGVGLTPAGNRMVYKTRIEVSFGRHPAK